MRYRSGAEALKKTQECFERTQDAVNHARDKFVREQIARNSAPTQESLNQVERLLTAIVANGMNPPGHSNLTSWVHKFQTLVPIAMREIRTAFVGFEPAVPKQRIGFVD